ncbi:MAG: hypothetical protein WC508_02845 [Patescibacteria group bacterium]
MIEIIFNIVGIFVVGIVQVSLLTTWPPPVSSLNLILSLVIFLAVIVNYQKGLWWALGAGLFLELYSAYSFGTTTLSLLAVVILINFLFSNLFTNRSLYSLLILGFIGTLSYNLFILFFNALALISGSSSYFLIFDFWSQFFWQPLFNTLILAIIFFTFHISTGRLKNIFLFPSNAYENKSQR